MHIHAWICAIGLCLQSSVVIAQAYPTKAIRMVIPAGAGGTVDTISRLIAPKLSEAVGQPVIADNRPGAGTMLASELTAKSPPDGYTILMVTNSHAINASLHKQLPYDPIQDFSGIILIAVSPYLLIVHPAVPAKSVRELIALAKQRPGQILFSSAGTGSSTHLAGELFKSMARIDIVHVPYKGGSAAQIGLAAGEVALMFIGPIATAPLIKAGRVRALAVTSAKRSPSMPHMPTVAEAGLPDYEAASWYGVTAPARTPPSVISKLNREISAVMKIPDVRDRIEALGADVTTSTPEELTSLMTRDIQRWAKIIPGLGLKVE